MPSSRLPAPTPTAGAHYDDLGTLQVGNGGTSGSIVGNVANNGTLAFNRSDNVAFSGTVSGSGALVQLGSGILTLTADNTYSGNTVVAAGRSRLATAAPRARSWAMC